MNLLHELALQPFYLYLTEKTALAQKLSTICDLGKRQSARRRTRTNWKRLRAEEHQIDTTTKIRVGSILRKSFLKKQKEKKGGSRVAYFFVSAERL